MSERLYFLICQSGGVRGLTDEKTKVKPEKQEEAERWTRSGCGERKTVAATGVVKEHTEARRWRRQSTVSPPGGSCILEDDSSHSEQR